MKKLMTLPVIGVVVAMLGASVFAASPTPGAIKAVDADGKDLGDKIIITRNVDNENTGAKGKTFKDLGLAAGDKTFKDEEIVVTEVLDISINTAAGWSAADIEWPIQVTLDPQTSGDVFYTAHWTGSWAICGGPDSQYAQISAASLSPFLIAKASANSSAQTGEYAGAYVVMVAVALVAAGAVFAIRAKKATR